jgi:hypothetical protein
MSMEGKYTYAKLGLRTVGIKEAAVSHLNLILEANLTSDVKLPSMVIYLGLSWKN